MQKISVICYNEYKLMNCQCNVTYFADIKNGECTFLQVVESLQTLLTHESVEQREKGIEVIVAILKELHDNSISDSELRIICNFLLQRLRDRHQVRYTSLTTTKSKIRMTINSMICFCVQPETLNTIKVLLSCRCCLSLLRGLK